MSTPASGAGAAIRTLVVGLGSRGGDWVRELRAAPAFELAGAVDPDASARARAVAAWRIPADRCLATLDEAFDHLVFDAVIVVSPADEHTAACALALSRGCAVLVEKPFTTTLEEAVRLVELADRTGRPLVVGHNYRSMRAFRTARQLVADGRLGRLAFLNLQYYRVPHDVAPSLGRMEHSVLWGMGIHHLDVMRYLTGDTVTGVVADAFTTAWGALPHGASLEVLLSFAGGTRAVYTATYESSGHEYFERGQEFYGRLVGERATLHIFHRWLVLCERGRLPRLVRRGPRTVTEERVLLDDLARGMATGEPARTSGRDNLETMAIVSACLRSLTTRAWVDPRALLS